MSSEATHFVRRHVRGITLVERAVLLTVADRCGANGKTPRGRGPSHATLADELEMSERTIRRWIDALVEKKAIVVPGRCTFEIPGVDEHDPAICGHGECAKANRPDVAGKHGRASTRSGQMWPTNRPDVAAKTFSPTERDRAGRAQGSAQRPGVAVSCHFFSDDGSGTCAECALPELNSRHLPGAPHGTPVPNPSTLLPDLRGRAAGRQAGTTEQPRPQDEGDRGDREASPGTGPAGEDRADDADRPGVHGDAQGYRAVALPGGRVISLPASRQVS